MNDRQPIRKAEELDGMDSLEMVEGYHDGRAGDPAPGDNRSKAYWHGWRNGRVDGGFDEGDEHMWALAHDIVAKQRSKP